MPAPSTNSIFIGTGAVVSIVLGIAVFAMRGRISPSMHLVLVAGAVLALSVLIGQSPSAIGDVAMASLYTCIACHAALVFSWRQAAVITAAAVASCLAVTFFDSDLPAWSVIPTVVATVVIACAVCAVTAVARQAVVDQQTGLFNRRGFDLAVATEIASVAASGSVLSLILLNLDRFKSINDHLGHVAADAVLDDVAERWRSEVGDDVFLARYGGDEFAVLLPGTTEAAAFRLAERLRAAISTECSAGVTSWCRGDTASLFVGRADIALYRAKVAGRGRTAIESSTRPELIGRVRDAIDNGALEVYFQPIVRVSAANATVAVEALVRWPMAPADSEITPEGIVRLAENNGLITDLGRYVLENACTQAHLLAVDATELILSVNVSGLELLDSDYADTVLNTLLRTGWPAHRLVLEITERDLAADSPAANGQLNQLREAGIRVAVDDFGSGYSSLARVATLPCDILKVDQAIVANPLAAGPLLDAIVGIARAFSLEVIVEGIETAEQADLVSAHGADLAQGYYFARPQPAARVRP
jgi:diguanylate cyclase (GGDEF)-like protein